MEEKSRKYACPNRLLRAAREQRGWSQKSLANMIGTSELTVGRWERGERSPQLFYRARLCEAFGMAANELGFGEVGTHRLAVSGEISFDRRTIELSTLPGSFSPPSPVLSSTSKKQKTWSGRMVRVALAVLNVLSWDRGG